MPVREGEEGWNHKDRWKEEEPDDSTRARMDVVDDLDQPITNFNEIKRICFSIPFRSSDWLDVSEIASWFPLKH